MTNGNGKITNKDLYEAIERLENKICARYDAKFSRLELQIDENTSWRNKIVGQFAIIMVIIGAGINWLFGQFSK